ncbi:MAG: GNAT family N-acetyltransferase, partial [Rhizobiales bacterium]|nr:GNAT family N-acetyltransferase [Hyphomicrobiales bacterium]
QRQPDRMPIHGVVAAPKAFVDYCTRMPSECSSGIMGESRVTLDDMHMRFFTAKPDRSHRFAARLTQIDYAREMAFVVLSESEDDLLGVSRLSADPDYTRAEYAVLVRSDLKGKGLGWLLMQHLIAYAREEGLGALYGEILATNTTMLEMCQSLGFVVAPDAEDTTLRHATLKLKAAS